MLASYCSDVQRDGVHLAFSACNAVFTTKVNAAESGRHFVGKAGTGNQRAFGPEMKWRDVKWMTPTVHAYRI